MLSYTEQLQRIVRAYRECTTAQRRELPAGEAQPVAARRGNPNTSVLMLARARRFSLHIPDSVNDPQPHRPAVHVSTLEHGVDLHRGVNRGFVTVLLDERCGGAKNVNVIDCHCSADKCCVTTPTVGQCGRVSTSRDSQFPQ